MRKTGILLIAFIGVLTVFCNYPAPLSDGGGASETINAKIIIIDSGACVIPDTPLTQPLSIHVYDKGYRPYEGMGFTDSFADASASRWLAPLAGIYNFYISLPSGKTAFVPGIALERGLHDTVSFVLGQGHDITGSFACEGSFSSQEPTVLYITGSPFVAETDAAGQFTFANIPSGAFILTTRPVARFFLSTTDYAITTENLGSRIKLVLNNQ